MGQGTAARARVGSPTPEFLPAWWILRAVLHFSLLFTLTRPLPTILMGTLQSAPCPSPPVAHGLGRRTGSQQAGAVWLGVESQDGAPSPFRGTGQELTVAGEVIGRLRVILSPLPVLTLEQKAGWLPVTSCDEGPGAKVDPSPRKVQLLHLSSPFPASPKCRLMMTKGKFWIPGFGALTLHFAAQGWLEPSQGGRLGTWARFLLFFR